jgi:hypothetical protein
LNTVNYSGTATEWDWIGIGSNNDGLQGATRNYNYVYE